MAGEFLKKLELFAELDEAETHVFTSLAKGEKTLNEGETLFVDGARHPNLYIVKSGWFYSYAILPDGSRQIHEIFTAGDVIGVEHLSWSVAMSCVSAASKGVLTRWDVTETRNALSSEPRLNAIFYALHMLHSVLLLDRITAVSRLGAYARLAYFMADALARQNMILDAETDLLHLPLSQSFIADCLGLSSVHVSRQVGKLLKNGIIEKQGRYDLFIRDKEQLLSLGDYTNRFSDIDRAGFDLNFGNLSDEMKAE